MPAEPLRHVQAAQEKLDAIAHIEEELMAEDEDEDMLGNLAPKNPNWDLKRDIAPKLEQLEQQTNRAIITLIRQKLSKQGGDHGGKSLVEAVNMQMDMEGGAGGGGSTT